MYILTEAKKLDFIWKLWRRNIDELKVFDYGPQKCQELYAKGSDLPFSTP